MGMELQLFERPSSVLEDEGGLQSKKEADDEMKEKKVQQHESAKAEMSKMKEENERLKTIISHILRDYQSLGTHFFHINVQEESGAATGTAATIISSSGQDIEETEFITLSLGNNPTAAQNEEEKVSNKNREKMGFAHQEEGLDLGLDCKFQRSDQSSQKSCREDMAEEWPPRKLLKAPRSSEDGFLQQAYAKKARVSVRMRCDTTTMEDGCQWRKYGQKISKGNPCPRAYYRCTAAPSCPVKKQVQRCAEDMSILITTYEGAHNHPLPVQATVMASTTSAAARMLMSSSSTSTSGTSNSAGFTLNLSDYKSRSSPFYLPNPATSASPSYPSTTLDLTSTSSAHRFNSLPSTFSYVPKHYTSIGLPNFSFPSDQSCHLPNSWNTSSGRFSNYGPHQLNNGTAVPSALARPPLEKFYQTTRQKLSPISPSPSLPSSQQHLSETTDAVAKAITSEPRFRSALAAAIPSVASGSNGGSHPLQVKDETVAQYLEGRQKLLSLMAASSSGGGGSGCGPIHLN